MHGEFYPVYQMNLSRACAVVDEKLVSYKDNIKSEAYILIDCNKYKCMNRKELVDDCLNLIYKYSKDIIFYNGNIDFDGEAVKEKTLKSFIPTKLFDFIERVIFPY